MSEEVRLEDVYSAKKLIEKIPSEITCHCGHTIKLSKDKARHVLITHGSKIGHIYCVNCFFKYVTKELSK